MLCIGTFVLIISRRPLQIPNTVFLHFADTDGWSRARAVAVGHDNVVEGLSIFPEMCLVYLEMGKFVRNAVGEGKYLRLLNFTISSRYFLSLDHSGW